MLNWLTRLIKPKKQEQTPALPDTAPQSLQGAGDELKPTSTRIPDALMQIIRKGNDAETVTVIQNNHQMYTVVDIRVDDESIVLELEDRKPRFYSLNGIRPASLFEDLRRAISDHPEKILQVYSPSDSRQHRLEYEGNTYRLMAPDHKSHPYHQFADYNRRNPLRLRENAFQGLLHFEQVNTPTSTSYTEIPERWPEQCAEIQAITLKARFRQPGSDYVNKRGIPLIQHFHLLGVHALLVTPHLVANYPKVGCQVIGRLLAMYQIGKTKLDENDQVLISMTKYGSWQQPREYLYTKKSTEQGKQSTTPGWKDNLLIVFNENKHVYQICQKRKFNARYLQKSITTPTDDRFRDKIERIQSNEAILTDPESFDAFMDTMSHKIGGGLIRGIQPAEPLDEENWWEGFTPDSEPTEATPEPTPEQATTPDKYIQSKPEPRIQGRKKRKRQPKRRVPKLKTEEQINDFMADMQRRISGTSPKRNNP